MVFGFVRIAGNPRILRPPMPVEAALGHVEAWLARRHVHLLAPGPRHLELPFRLLRDAGVAADLTTHAQIAAHALELGADGNDGDFGRFEGLRWRNPLA